MKLVKLIKENVPVAIASTLLGFIGLLLVFDKHSLAQKITDYILIVSLVLVGFVALKSKNRIEIQKSDSLPKQLVYFGRSVVLITGLLVFWSIISPGPVVWGDAPYFYPDAFKNFSPFPLVWESRGRFGVVNDLYWIYPLMLIYRGLGALGFGNDIIVRLLFYIPGILLAGISPWFLTRYLKFSPIVSIFSSFIYVFSSYFILVVDGGQIGVALAYGLFPLALLGLLKFIEKPTLDQFFPSLGIFILLITADVRFAAMAIFTIILWKFNKIRIKSWKIFGLFTTAVLGLSAYWLIPAFEIHSTTGSGVSSGLPLVSALNTLLLYSPHWPQNEFGKISQIPWYFLGIPLLTFASIFFRKDRKTFILVFYFLFFAFLAKGESGVFGSLYSWVINSLPLGGAFRDSTKFFAPLTLFAGILIGLTIENLNIRFKKASGITLILVFAYLIFLIHPAVLQRMHGVLSGRDFPQSLSIIAEKLSSENNFLRVVWFPERYPLSFHTEAKPALDAKSLIDLRPFARLNTGISDVFNFLHNDETYDWLRLFGIKYLAFSGDVRQSSLSSGDQEDWNNLLSLVASKNWLNKVDWGTKFPVYEVKNIAPRVFGVNQVVLVVGADDIYEKLKSVKPEFSPINQGFIFLEDGKTNPDRLVDIPPDSTLLVFNDKQKEDLVFGYLQKYFIASKESKNSQWAIRTSADYLKWKYELLVNNIKTSEFDYAQGIAFSSQPREKITFELPTTEKGSYILAIRSLGREGSLPIKGMIDDKSFKVFQKTSGQFSWYELPDLNLEVGKHLLQLENTDGFQVINTVALIPQPEWVTAQDKSDKLFQKMNHFQVDSTIGIESLGNALSGTIQKIDYYQKSPSEYDLNIPQVINWLVFTDNYHNSWQISETNSHAFAFYSTVNGFYVKRDGEQKIIFSEQNKILPGLFISVASLVIILGLYLIQKLRSRPIGIQK